MLVYGSVPMLVSAAEEHFGEEVDLIAVLAFELGLAMGEHGSAAVTLLMLTGGEALEHYVFARARQNLGHVLDDTAPKTRILRSMSYKEKLNSEEDFDLADLAMLEFEDVDAEDVCVGDILAVRAGEAVPVDGSICALPKVGPAAAEGAPRKSVVTVDESLLTGESAEAVKSSSDTVFSGSIAKGPLWLCAKAQYEGSTLQLMRRALQDALDRKAGLQRRSDRAASLLQPLTLAAAVLCLALRRRASILRRWSTVLSVLTAATPCPAAIGVPIAFLSCMSVAARSGVLIKSGAAIEALATAKHLALDKTGTLTAGRPRVQSFEVFLEGRRIQSDAEGGAEWMEALQLVASVEVLSTHPFASAILDFASASDVSPLEAEEVEVFPGAGVAGTVGGRRVVVGTWPFLQEQGAAGMPETEAAGSGGVDEALLQTFVAVNGRPAGCIYLRDELKPGTGAAVARLRALGLEVTIISGDRSAHLRVVAKELGVADARGGCLPHEKAAAIQELNAAGGVIMVGDESNDAAALAAAGVGVAVGKKSGLASASADVVVGESNSLDHLAKLVDLCRVTVSTAQRGAQTGLSVSATQVLVACAGLIPPRTNAILQEVVDVTALLNAASVLRYRWDGA